MTEEKIDTLDPVVARTRKAREDLARRCDYDLDKMIELFKSMQEEHPDRVRFPERSRAGGMIRVGDQGQ